MAAGVEMDVTLALLADAANRERSGKLNVLGVFDRIWAKRFPVVHPMMNLVLRFSAGPAEFGQEKEFDVALIGADGGKPIGQIKGRIKVPTPAVPGRRATWIEILPLPNTPFTSEGDYQFAILIGGDTKAEIPLAIVQVQEGDDGDSNPG